MDGLASAYRVQSLQTRAASLRDLQRIWATLDFTNLDGSFPRLLAALTPVIQRDRGQVAAAAASYLATHRARAGIAGHFSARLAGPAPAAQIAASLRVTSVVAVKKATLAGFGQDRALAVGFTQTAGAVGRLVLNAGRDTVTKTTIADPHAVGWQRVGVGKCDFCQKLLDRGAVYTEASADFEAHDGCACSAEPVYT